jgi:RNase P subunit RPR2
MTLKITSLSAILAILALSCATDSEKNTDGNFTNPNGTSELAILMNDLYIEAENAKQQIARGEMPELTLDAEKILTAAATEPDKVASPEYKAFAHAYIESVKLLKNASRRSEAAEHYKIMAAACMNCHKAICPGPTKRIRKLL